MKICKLMGEFDDFSHCEYADESNHWPLKEKLRNKVNVKEWEEVEITHDISKPVGDLAYNCNNTDAFIISQKAKDVFSVFESSIQFLDVKSITYPEQKFYMMHVTKHIEAFDKEKSVYSINEVLDSNNIQRKIIARIKKYAFTPIAKNEPIFHLFLGGIVKSGVFVNDAFVDVVQNNGLTGFKFVELFEFDENV